MQIARLPNGQFAPGNRGGPGRPGAGEPTKADLQAPAGNHCGVAGRRRKPDRPDDADAHRANMRA